MPRITTAWMDRRQPPGLHWDNATLGLGVRVWKNGSTKSWVHQRRGVRRVTLGQWPIMQIADARQAALDAEMRRFAPAGRTFKELHDIWAADHINQGGAETTVRENAGRVGKHAAEWWSRDAVDVSPADLIQLRNSIVTSAGIHPARDTVAHLRRLAELATGQRMVLPALGRPRSTRGRRSQDIETWWPEIVATSSPLMLDAHRIIALTGMRPGDVRRMRRSHLSEDGWLLVPSPKSKMGRDLSFRRPLPSQAMAILDRLDEDHPFPLNEIRCPAGSFANLLRHHYIGVAESETAVPRRVLKALVNHTGADSVTDGYGAPSPDVLPRWSQEIADCVSSKIGLV